MTGIKEGIFEAFLSKLRDDSNFSRNNIEELEKMLKSEEKVTKEKILQALEGDTKNDDRH